MIHKTVIFNFHCRWQSEVIVLRNFFGIWMSVSAVQSIKNINQSVVCIIPAKVFNCCSCTSFYYLTEKFDVDWKYLLLLVFILDLNIIEFKSCWVQLFFFFFFSIFPWLIKKKPHQVGQECLLAMWSHIWFGFHAYLASKSCWGHLSLLTFWSWKI